MKLCGWKSYIENLSEIHNLLCQNNKTHNDRQTKKRFQL